MESNLNGILVKKLEIGVKNSQNSFQQTCLRFSGFGEPKLPTELVQLDDDACLECAAFSISTVDSLILLRGVFEVNEFDWLAVGCDASEGSGCMDAELLLECDGSGFISTDTTIGSCG